MHFIYYATPNIPHKRLGLSYIMSQNQNAIGKIIILRQEATQTLQYTE